MSGEGLFNAADCTTATTLSLDDLRRVWDKLGPRQRPRKKIRVTPAMYEAIKRRVPVAERPPDLPLSLVGMRVEIDLPDWHPTGYEIVDE